MAAPRKVFRIEQTPAARMVRRGDAIAAVAADVETPAAPLPPPPLALPAPEPMSDDEHAAVAVANLERIARELDAVTGGTAHATQKILAAAEEIDQLADNLAVALKGRIEHDLVQDIAEHVIRIFEACNFQDLISQRVGKVMRTLTSDGAVDEALPHLHGPRLDDDDDHMTQPEIDVLFGV